jgi:hypothetical protein
MADRIAGGERKMSIKMIIPMSIEDSVGEGDSGVFLFS